MTINGKKHWLWRAVDQHGAVLEVLVQSGRDKAAAKRLRRKLLKRHGGPRVIVTGEAIAQLLAKQDINHNTLVWKQGMATWAPLSTTELVSHLQETAKPPVLPASQMNNKFLWLLAFSPVICWIAEVTCALFQYGDIPFFIKNALENNHYWYTTVAILLGLGWADYKALEKAGVNLQKLNKFWILLTPGYIWKRWPARPLTRCSRFLVDTSRWGGRKTGPNPTDRARPGSKHHILVDANGVPISAILTGANRNDVTQLLPLVDAIAPIRGARGRPLRKPKVIYADRGYDSDAHRQRLRKRGIKPVIARRRTEHGSGLGKFRWVVERTHSWLHNFRRLRIRFDRRADIHEAFLRFGCALVCWNTFRRTQQPF